MNHILFGCDLLDVKEEELEKKKEQLKKDMNQI